jgi:hypothetical protein
MLQALPESLPLHRTHSADEDKNMIADTDVVDTDVD